MVSADCTTPAAIDSDSSNDSISMSISKKLDVPLSPMLCEDLTEEEQRHKEQEEKQRMTRQTISLFISTFLFSLMGMFLQLATRHGVPSTEIVFSRAAFQGIFIIPAMFLFRLSPSDADALPPTQDKDVEEDDEEVDMKFAAANSFENEATTTTLPPRIIQHPFGTTKIMSNVVMLRGIFGGLSFMFKFHALSTLPLGDATALMAVYPVITIFLAHIFLGEVIRPLHIVAAISSILGAVLISQPRFLFGDGNDAGDDVDDDTYQGYAGYISAFLENIFCSGVIVTIRKAGKVGAHTLQLLFSWMVFALSLSMLMFFVGRSSSEIVESWIVPPAEALPSLLGTCMAAGVAHFLLNYSGKFVPATMGGLIRSSGILIAYLLEVFVFGTTPETVTIWGVFFILLSLMIVLFQGKVDELVSFLVCQAGEYRPRMSSTFGWAKEDHRDNNNIHRQFSVA